MEFIADPFAADPSQFTGMSGDGRGCLRVNFEPQPRGKACGPEGTKVVFRQPSIGVADGPEDFGIKILTTREKVKDRAVRRGEKHGPLGRGLRVCGVEKEGVDREISAGSVGLGVGVDDRVGASRIGIGPVRPERGDFDGVVVGPHEHHAEGCANTLGRRENPSDIFGPGVGCDVKILGLAAEQPVADAPAREIRDKPLGKEFDNDLGGGGSCGDAASVEPLNVGWKAGPMRRSTGPVKFVERLSERDRGCGPR